jgi:hypothetical protein
MQKKLGQNKISKNSEENVLLCILYDKGKWGRMKHGEMWNSRVNFFLVKYVFTSHGIWGKYWFSDEKNEKKSLIFIF